MNENIVYYYNIPYFPYFRFSVLLVKNEVSQLVSQPGITCESTLTCSTLVKKEDDLSISLTYSIVPVNYFTCSIGEESRLSFYFIIFLKK